MKRWGAVMMAAMALSACSDEGQLGPPCSDEARAGIIVTVRDAQTGEALADSALGLAYEGTFVDTLRQIPRLPVFNLSELVGVYERPGIYTVVIRRQGYQEWMQTNVVVKRDECHVIPVALLALLERVGELP